MEVTYIRVSTKVISEKTASRSLVATSQCWLSDHPSKYWSRGALHFALWWSSKISEQQKSCNILPQRKNFVKSVRKQYGNPDSHAFSLIVTSNFNISMYPRSFICEEARIKQYTFSSWKKELREIGEDAIWESRFTWFFILLRVLL